MLVSQIATLALFCQEKWFDYFWCAKFWKSWGSVSSPFVQGDFLGIWKIWRNLNDASLIIEAWNQDSWSYIWGSNPFASMIVRVVLRKVLPKIIGHEIWLSMYMLVKSTPTKIFIAN
jgi:hypothetical protein